MGRRFDMTDRDAANTESNRESSYPRFRLRTLLLITTAACLLLATTLAIVPKSLPTEMKVFAFLLFAAMFAYAARVIYQSKHRPWKLSENTITVQVDAKWLHRVKSPLILGPIAALTGVSLTAAPAYLLLCGQMDEFGIMEWVGVPASFLVIYFVPGFYMSLASEVIAQLLKHENSSASP